MDANDLRDAALTLPTEQRAELAYELLRSLDHTGDGDVDAAWIKEIERRARQLADGSVPPVDWEVARQRIANRLRERRQ